MRMSSFRLPHQLHLIEHLPGDLAVVLRVEQQRRRLMKRMSLRLAVGVDGQARVEAELLGEAAGVLLPESFAFSIAPADRLSLVAHHPFSGRDLGDSTQGSHRVARVPPYRPRGFDS